MQNLNLIDTFANFKENKEIDRPTMMGVLQEVFRNVFEKQFGSSDSFDFIINIDKGDFQIFQRKTIVPDGEVEDDFMQISISDVQKVEGDDYGDDDIGDEYSTQIKLEEFGRRTILSLRQNLSSKLLQLERENIFHRYKEKVGEIVNGEVYQVWKKEILVLDDEENEMIMPKSEQIPSDFFRKGDPVRAVVDRVEMKNNTPLIILSRTSSRFLERLFELEVPEIYDGLITIKKIVRVAGERAKVAVESYDERIDPVGACVGMKGARIHGIVRELRNENIDVINYSDNLKLFIQRALSPAKISKVNILEEEKRAEVYLNPEEVSKAIGKGGLNIKLAGKLVGYELDVFRDDEDGLEEDIDIMEFKDEIDEWVLNVFKSIGCDTAKSVLNIPREDLINRTDLEEETVDKVLDILRSEFEENK
jgi:N utilization substance protein A